MSKSLGERLLALREKWVQGYFIAWVDTMAADEWSAVFGDQGPTYPHHIRDQRLRYTIAIERAAVRELKKEGKL